jgi:hypothetical protein
VAEARTAAIRGRADERSVAVGEASSSRAAAQDYFNGWFDGDVSRMERAPHRDLVLVRSEPYHEYLHLVRTHDGWKIANALWCTP